MAPDDLPGLNCHRATCHKSDMANPKTCLPMVSQSNPENLRSRHLALAA